MRKTSLKIEPFLKAKLSAYPYQSEAFHALKDLEFAAIFHEQGLGKTKIAIDLSLYWLENKEIDTVLIVTKKQLVGNWIKELSFHTHLRPGVLSNNRTDNYFVFNGPARIILTNFEIISVEKSRFQLYLQARNVAIIIDESAKIKNPMSTLTQDFFSLSDYFKIKVIMTGTPVANRPFDVWAQIYFLDKGKSLGTNFSEFKKNTDLTNKLATDIQKREDFEEKTSNIYQKISWFSVRETKNSGIINLPDKKYYNVFTDFEVEQKVMYDKIRDEMVLLISKGDKSLLDESSATLKRLLRLVQATSNPRLIDDMYFGGSSKEILLDDLLQEIINRGEKCIVWSIFKGNVDYFTNRYSHYNSVKIHGGMKISDRNKSIEKFSDIEYKVLFATPQSAKEGLTLTMANNVIFYDRGFSLDDYVQAQDRIHRISQTKNCNIYNLIVNDSIDIWIDVLLQAKQNAASLAQGDISKNEYKDIADYSFANLVKNILNIEEDEL